MIGTICALMVSLVPAGLPGFDPGGSQSFVGEKRVLAGGLVEGVVRLNSGKVIVEIQSSAGGKSPEQRAVEIAARLQRASERDNKWWRGKNIQPGTANKEVVVGISREIIPTGYIITCDSGMARYWNSSPSLYAHLVVTQIQYALDLSKRGMFIKGPAEVTIEERHLQAINDRQSADRFREQGNVVRAIAHYEDAAMKLPDYEVAWESLAALYAEAGKSEKAADANKIVSDLKRAAPEKLLGDTSAAQAKQQPAGSKRAREFYEQAAKHYDAARSELKECVTYWLLMADAQREAGKTEAARKTLQECLQALYPDGNLLAPHWGEEFITTWLKRPEAVHP